jgi:hypothetical protein
MIGLLILVGEVVRGTVVLSGSTESKTPSKTGRSRGEVKCQPARRDLDAGGWFAAADPGPASGEPR